MNSHTISFVFGLISVIYMLFILVRIGPYLKRVAELRSEAERWGNSASG